MKRYWILFVFLLLGVFLFQGFQRDVAQELTVASQQNTQVDPTVASGSLENSVAGTDFSSGEQTTKPGQQQHASEEDQEASNPTAKQNESNEALPESVHLLKAQVVDNYGQPIPGATVELKSTQGTHGYAETDDQGMAYFGEETIDLGATFMVFFNASAPEHTKGVKRITQQTFGETNIIVLHKGKSLEMQVVNEDDEPIQGAIVRIEADSRTAYARDKVGETDAHGRLQVPVFPKHAILEVSKRPEYASKDVTTVYPDELLIVVLEKRLNISGTVTDAQTGKPLEGFEARLSIEGSGNAHINTFKGDFEFVAYSENTYQLELRKEGYDSLTIPSIEAGERLTLEMEPSNKNIHGVALDLNGNPIPDVKLILTSLDINQYPYDGSQLWDCIESKKGCPVMDRYDPAVTGRNGKFIINNVGKYDTYALFISGPYVPKFVMPLPEGYPESKDPLILNLPFPAKVYGSFSSEDFPNATSVTLLYEGTPVETHNVEVLVNKDTSFSFDELPPGQYVIRLNGPVLFDEQRFALGPSEQKEIIFEDPSLELEGIVHIQGSPAKDITLTLGKKYVSTNNEGYFKFEKMPAGNHKVYMIEGYFPDDANVYAVNEDPLGNLVELQSWHHFVKLHENSFEVEIVDQSEWVDVAFFPRGDLKGTLPEAGAGNIWITSQRMKMYAQLKDDGSFTFAQVPPGSYFLYHNKPRVPTKLMSYRLDMPDAQDLNLAQMSALQRGGLKVVFEGYKNRALLSRILDLETRQVVLETWNSEDGVMQIPNIPVGSWVLSVVVDGGYTDAFETVIEIHKNKTFVQELDLTASH